jgi:hypothetical protein
MCPLMYVKNEYRENDVVMHLGIMLMRVYLGVHET